EGGHKADVPLKKAVEGDLPALVREGVGPQLSRVDEKQAGALVHTTMENAALGKGTEDRSLGKLLLLTGSQLVPYGEKLRNLSHEYSLPLRTIQHQDTTGAHF